ncbi:P-loop containing nucleoside triphosphate hydrolase protein [Lobosporangium transversale]|uniref:p-loop containing nucleoside triphosphate hydrolase protein n=1 Tax=Lobosporangium transversale TaxID=64571 RepID=A0A1Y2GR10_9FUNG|nr:P-loop containing nucleoside triphosphate hydrolase protein [Lobosporangium transversale]ORZ19947.1 P-loop containing nucleoside triphosphate hydrolase protein [Lobosporangium transversale]|eukprot:XP_021882487.1 P-loop containing nucleoside triphosphate hydrolase protein [Lobosporangium transversale]
MQKQEIREAVELPLTHFNFYRQIDIYPPRGTLLYGPPGISKTTLVKAVAHHISASFFRMAGSEFLQKYLTATQLDGFDQGSNVKAIVAINLADTLDPTILRPDRLDCKIEFPTQIVIRSD